MSAAHLTGAITSVQTESPVVIDSTLEALLADPVRQAEARSRLRRQIDAAPRTLTYKHWLGRLPPAAGARSVAWLSTFTLETIEPFLQVEAYLSGWRCTSRYYPYGQWQQALLAPDGVAVAGHDAAVLLIQDSEWLDAEPTPEAAAARVVALIEGFRRHARLPLFVGVVPAPADAHGLAFGEPAGQGRQQRRAWFAHHLLEGARRHADVYPLDLGFTATGDVDWFDPTAFVASRSVFAHGALPTLARRVARPLACLFRPRRKVLVLDLDNTLWGGVVGEDGVDGVVLGTEYPGAGFVDFQRRMQALRASGILLALASKNNEADARAVFDQRREMVLAWSDFSARRIDWQDKAGNIRAMADELGLGLDSFVFADDSPIECALVREALPQVEVVELGRDPTRFADKVLATQAFDTLHVSAEDRARAASYAAEAGRQELRTQATDLAAFLADCRLQLAIQPVGEATLDRIHQLMGKTNQFNFTLERHTKDALRAIASDGTRLFSISLTDRFGDYGLIGILHLEPQGRDLRVANMALSCRALGRGVEDAMLAFAREIARGLGCERLLVRCVRGPRNQQVFEFVQRKGFENVHADAAASDFALPATTEELRWPPFLSVDSPLKEAVA